MLETNGGPQDGRRGRYGGQCEEKKGDARALDLAGADKKEWGLIYFQFQVGEEHQGAEICANRAWEADIRGIETLNNGGTGGSWKEISSRRTAWDGMAEETA